MTRWIDAHQHFWSLTTPGHEWPTAAEAPIHRDFGPDELLSSLDGLDLAGSVLVQSQPTDADTDWMLALAERTPLVRAVVGWVDLADPAAPDRIAALAANPLLRGLRPMLQAIEDSDWLLGEALTPAIAAVKAAGLRLDALVQPRHLPMLARFVERWPDLPIVIDHAAKPFAATGTLDPWRGDLALLAAFPNVSCKVSGMVTEVGQDWRLADLRPYVDHVAALFGEDRLMFGSDWPVALLAAPYGEVAHAARALLGAHFGPAGMAKIFGANAARFYKVEVA